ncbi:pyridoxamine 5'-phosphate oxidase-like FMN-binding protein [Natronococcus amylolyticus DSM 10524]|uniref:Pyridoxamine 5'-phosphate oxidase-like FMN-binding protein n=1 Tax=Natronococcus amylolyticus DSM 10524 TaxID=1227497 RepID=L9XIQ6_9EURY|nr:pyridoxamine 5'-phosphate oxidase family protein [Natronococcus amylolyticus]ELY61306.1 pyridoxamine 5'-phosphate oxidase-like FMN-binding protein [Natronococcus amylolyticus DSM 10524]
MELIENALEVELDACLARPLFCFLAQRSDSGPRVSPLWFLWGDQRVWLIAQLEGRSYPDRVQQDPETALAVVDFDPATGRVEHVGMRGTASLEPYDEKRAGGLLEKYLGTRRENWPAAFVDLDPDAYRLLEFTPETVVARDQSYPAPPTPKDCG